MRDVSTFARQAAQMAQPAKDSNPTDTHVHVTVSLKKETLPNNLWHKPVMSFLAQCDEILFFDSI